MLSAEGVLERERGMEAKIKMSQLGSQCRGGRGGPGHSLPFIRPSGHDPEQSREGEKPQTSCSLAGMYRQLGEGRSRVQRGNKKNKQIFNKHLCRHRGDTCPVSHKNTDGRESYENNQNKQKVRTGLFHARDDEHVWQ